MLLVIASRLGDGPAWYGLMLVLLVFGGSQGGMAAMHMLATGLVAWLLYRCIKNRSRRPRPYRRCNKIVLLTPPLDEFSFPSGHTLHAVSFSLVAVHYFPALAWPLAVFAALVALSRVLLGLHYPSDVLASLIGGFLLARGSLWLWPWQ